MKESHQRAASRAKSYTTDLSPEERAAIVRRNVLVMAYCNGEPAEEIADLLKVPLETVTETLRMASAAS